MWKLLFLVFIMLTTSTGFGAEWELIGGPFPPTLNSHSPSALLRPNETPACYGVDCTADGYLTPGSIVTGTAHTPYTTTATLYGGASLSGTYRKYYNRLWRASGSTLYFGAPWYQSTNFVPQDFAWSYTFPTTIVEFMPFGSDSMIVFLTNKAAVGIMNCADSRAFFQLTQLREDLIITAANQVVDADRAAAVSTADGVYLVTDEGIQELTRPVRGDSDFANATMSYQRGFKRLIGANKFVIDISGEQPRIFDYSTSGFLYTTPTLVDAGGRPFVPEQVQFVFESTTGADGTATLQYARNGTWSSNSQTLRFKATSQETPTLASWVPDSRIAAHEWAFRLTSLSSHIRIRAIYMYSSRKRADGYTGGN